MKNIIATRLPRIVGQARLVLPALAEYGETLGLTRVTHAAMSQNLTNLTNAWLATDTAKAELLERRKALQALFKRGRKHAATARNALKFHLGDRVSGDWTLAGYEGSLAIPRTMAPLRDLLLRLSRYLAQHPEYENAAMEVTAADTEALYTELVAADTAVSVQQRITRQLIDVREAMMEIVRKDLRRLLAELKLVLDPLSGIWQSFHFKRPGSQHVPEAPVDVSVELAGPSTAVISLPRPAGAARLHVWQKVVGVDAEFQRIATRRDLPISVHELPANAEIEFALSGVNNAGEGLRSETVKVVTPVDFSLRGAGNTGGRVVLRI